MVLGGTKTLEVSGLLAGEEVHAFLFSSPQYIGSAHADPRGIATIRFTVPAWLVPGQHHIEVRTAAGSLWLPLTVTNAGQQGGQGGEPGGQGGETGPRGAVPPAGQVTVPSAMPATGLDFAAGPVTGGAALIVLLGLLLVIARRSRRHS